LVPKLPFAASPLSFYAMPFLSRFFRHLAVAVGLPALVLAAAPAVRAQAPTTPSDLPASQAAGIIREITDAVGLQPRFELRATTMVPNAAAVMYDGKRFLLYNPKFLAAINRAGHTDWAGISILAHEMGHHLNGHTLRGGGSQPQDELEADEFSGFVLRRLGASLAQAQAAIATVAPTPAECRALRPSARAGIALAPKLRQLTKLVRRSLRPSRWC
jgi:hypothetical protein